MKEECEDDIKVSICCLTYNHADYIEDCLQGFLMQKTSFLFEILINEDASTDGTAQIIKEYEEKYPSIIKPIYQEKNKFSKEGGGMNIRYNFPRAKGKYIALCEGDDYWTDPLKLQKQVDFMETNKEYPGCFHNTMFLNENEGCSDLKPWREYKKNVFYLEDLISFTSLFHTSSFLYRKSSINIPDWIVDVQSGDMALFAIVGLKGPLFRLNEYMSVYRKNSTGVTNFIKIEEYHKNRIKLWEYFSNICPGESQHKLFEVIEYHTTELKKYKKGKKKWFKNFRFLL